ncbi:MAG: winged helix-turn-helix transcriptional regulator [Actinomycetota bacterium]
MARLLWLAHERVDPEVSFPALAGRHPAPESLAFAEATPEIISTRLPDAVIVDGRARPDEAAAVVRKLRDDTGATFLAVLSSEDLTSYDWSCGVADFVTDTCSSEELETRILRLSRPTESEPTDLVRRGAITIDRDRFEVRIHGQALDLTYKEFELLAHLAARPGKVCTRSSLLREVWGYDFFGGTRTVDVHIRRLRAKLGPDAHTVETVRNVGYRFAR